MKIQPTHRFNATKKNSTSCINPDAFIKSHHILLQTLLIGLFICSTSCNSGGNNANEEDSTTTEDNTQYHATERPEGELWGEVEINNFIHDAAGIDKMQIKAAEVAKERANHDAVLGYAETLKSDHSNSLKSLKKIATQEDVTLTDFIAASHQEKLLELKTTDTKFDEYFLKMMVEGHKKDIDKYQDAMTHLSNDHPLKAWINDVVPIMQQHQYRAQKLLQDDSLFPSADQ